jgi:hypothetical protein
MKIKRFSIDEGGVFDLDRLKNNLISVLAARQIIDTSKGILEKNGISSIEDILPKSKKGEEYKKEVKEEFSYEDFPKIRKNNITLRKPEIKYRKEEKEETPEIIHRSVMEYPEEED